MLGPVVDQFFCPELSDEFKVFRSGGRDHVSADSVSELDCEKADRAGAAMDQDPVSLPEMSAIK
jgi:hypothetical protein